MLLGLLALGRFFGFDFPAEFFVFGVLCPAAFVFVVFGCFFVAFFLVGFGFIVGGVGDE